MLFREILKAGGKKMYMILPRELATGPRGQFACLHPCQDAFKVTFERNVALLDSAIDDTLKIDPTT